MLELWTLCTALLHIASNIHTKFEMNQCSSIQVMLQTKFERKNQQRAITQIIIMLELWTLCTALLHIASNIHTKFEMNWCSSIQVMLRTKFERKNQQRAITQKIIMLELWTLCTALPLIMLFPYMKFHFNSSSKSGVIVRTKFERKNQQRAITQKICKLELWPLCTALPLIMLFPYMKFHFNSSSKSGVIVRTKFERKNQQRAITQKICMVELWPLCTALPFIMLFPYMKFHFNSSSRIGVIVRTRCVTDGRTDRQTDRRTDRQL